MNNQKWNLIFKEINEIDKSYVNQSYVHYIINLLDNNKELYSQVLDYYDFSIDEFINILSKPDSVSTTFLDELAITIINFKSKITSNAFSRKKNINI